MPTTPSSLPTSRDLLTSLIDSIVENGNQPPVPPLEDPRTAEARPFSQLPASIRPLLTTLHVLFPTLLLPALDLLDRSLITRVVSESPTGSAPQGQASQSSLVVGDSDDIPGESVSERLQPPCFFLVRSAASISRKTFNAFATSTPYIVRLHAWNCSCANFAFDAYPAASAGAAVDDGPLDIMGPGQGPRKAVPRKEVWDFGGLSFDGREPKGGGVPCCKHLLACLLADRWGNVLGRYAAEKRASKEEIAGLVADT